jgi:Adenylate and Guanylate cyclase catalytic domain
LFASPCKVFDGLGAKKKFVGGIVTSIYWQSCFRNILPDGSGKFIAVLQNGCNQTYSYSIQGDQVQYLGPEDMHDPKFDTLEVSSDLEQFPGSLQVRPANISNQCLYKLRMFPSVEYENEALTSTPMFYALGLACVFLFTSGFIFAYDWAVESRQRTVMTAAKHSGAIVSELFPAPVRANLYTDQEGNNSKKMGDEPLPKPSTPNATLYPDCTVLFADLAGFTKWSSSRTPADVFVLLETLYEAFDGRLRSHSFHQIGVGAR